MIEEGADTTISFPGRSPKQPLPGIGLHDPLHDWQDCPEFIVFDIGGWSNMSPVGTIFVPFPPKTGNNLLHPRPCQSLNGLCTYLQPWRGTGRGLRSFRTCTTTRMHLEGRNAPCKQYCARGLKQHMICTENVNVVRCTLQRLQVCTRATIASFTWSSSQNECQLIDIFILCLRRQYAATAAVTAATQSSMPIFNPREVCV